MAGQQPAVQQQAGQGQQQTGVSVAVQVKQMVSSDAVKKKFTEVLGQKAPQFLASITNVVAGILRQRSMTRYRERNSR